MQSTSTSCGGRDTCSDPPPHPTLGGDASDQGASDNSRCASQQARCDSLSRPHAASCQLSLRVHDDTSGRWMEVHDMMVATTPPRIHVRRLALRSAPKLEFRNWPKSNEYPFSARASYSHYPLHTALHSMGLLVPAGPGRDHWLLLQGLPSIRSHTISTCQKPA